MHLNNQTTISQSVGLVSRLQQNGEPNFKKNKIKLLKGILQQLHRHQDCQLKIQGKITQPKPKSVQPVENEDRQKVMENVILDYKKWILNKEQELIIQKQKKFSMYDDLEDIQIELQQNNKMLKFLNETIQEREHQITKLFQEINGLKKKRTTKKKKSVIETSFATHRNKSIDSPTSKANQSTWADQFQQQSERKHDSSYVEKRWI